jgi:hypothetical protein
MRNPGHTLTQGLSLPEPQDSVTVGPPWREIRRALKQQPRPAEGNPGRGDWEDQWGGEALLLLSLLLPLRFPLLVELFGRQLRS